MKQKVRLKKYQRKGIVITNKNNLLQFRTINQNNNLQNKLNKLSYMRFYMK